VSWKDPQTRRDIVYLLTMLVPIGYTVTYSVLAKLTGTSPRAIGTYMRQNRDLIIVPCHRVVSLRGLGGYSRGIEFKKRLLRVEGALENSALKRISSIEEFWKVVEKHGELIGVVDP